MTTGSNLQLSSGHRRVVSLDAAKKIWYVQDVREVAPLV